MLNFAGVLEFSFLCFLNIFETMSFFILILNKKNRNSSNKQDSTTEYGDVTVARRKHCSKVAQYADLKNEGILAATFTLGSPFISFSIPKIKPHVLFSYSIMWQMLECHKTKLLTLAQSFLTSHHLHLGELFSEQPPTHAHVLPRLGP